jgi:hypothetical protein
MIAHHMPMSVSFRERVMRENYINESAPKSPRCPSCAKPMQLIRRTSRFGGLPDLYSFYCSACDEWHIEEGDAPADRCQTQAFSGPGRAVL